MHVNSFDSKATGVAWSRVESNLPTQLVLVQVCMYRICTKRLNCVIYNASGLLQHVEVFLLVERSHYTL